MIFKSNITDIKTNLEEHLGSRVKLTSRRGRKKAIIHLGTIESTHPSIFTIKLEDEKTLARRLSFSYTDVLTKSIEIVLCS